MDEELKLQEWIEKEKRDREDIKFLVDQGMEAKEAVKEVVKTRCFCGNRHRTRADQAWVHSILEVK